MRSPNIISSTFIIPNVKARTYLKNFILILKYWWNTHFHNDIPNVKAGTYLQNFILILNTGETPEKTFTKEIITANGQIRIFQLCTFHRNIEPSSNVDICVYKLTIYLHTRIMLDEIFYKIKFTIYLILCLSDFCLSSCNCWNVRKTSDVDSEKETILANFDF